MAMDFITDRSARHMLRINNLIEVPAYVKSASIDPESTADLPDHLFADEAHREFPLDTPGHVYLSAAYCKSASVKNKFVAASIKAAVARLPEVQADLQKLSDAMDASIKSSSVAQQPQFAVYVDFGPGDPQSDIETVKSGGVRGFYPINDAFETTEAAVKLGNESHQMPMELFVEGCQAICKAASAFRCMNQLPKKILTYGVERMPDYEFVKQQAVQRRDLTGDEVYLEIAASADVDTDHDSNEWAELWMHADTKHGVKYARHTLDPYQIFHSGMPKAAFERELASWTLLAGVPVPVAALAALKPDSLNQALSKQASEAVQAIVAKAANTAGDVLTNELATLDKPVQNAILKLVAQQ